MKLSIRYHAGNPNMCRIPELQIRQMAECEGGGWWMPKEHAEWLVRISDVADRSTVCPMTNLDGSARLTPMPE